MDNMLAFFSEREEQLEQEKQNWLRSQGWAYSSALPGSYWLWSKSFPASKIQWRWENGERVPSEPFTVNGATTEIALIIEMAWSDHWDDAKPREDRRDCS